MVGDAMIWVEGGRFEMGSNRHYVEEAPVRTATVAGFWIDETPVTNAQFELFVAATGYVTLAEIPPNPADYPDADPSMLKAGSAVFRPPSGRVPLDDHARWWCYVVGASWRNPYGGGSDVAALADHPVVQVSFADATAYAAWAGKDLPTEAEWEAAARGGLVGADYAWGSTLEPEGRILANYWQGSFPWRNVGRHRRTGTSPVRSYPPNGFGLYDMIGNVWEWTSDEIRPAGANRSSCCSLTRERSAAPLPRILKGGSHLCAPDYCRRYRPAARHAQQIDSPTTHIGFRCVRRPRPN